jgi:hypothetical protein
MVKVVLPTGGTILRLATQAKLPGRNLLAFWASLLTIVTSPFDERNFWGETCKGPQRATFTL